MEYNSGSNQVSNVESTKCIAQGQFWNYQHDNALIIRHKIILPIINIMPVWCIQGAKKVSFMACHSGKFLLVLPKSLFNQPRNVFHKQRWLQFFCNLNFWKNFTCPSGKLRTEFTSLIAKSTIPGLSDTTFVACWYNII